MSTLHTAGGMPLAFTQEDFLVLVDMTGTNRFHLPGTNAFVFKQKLDFASFVKLLSHYANQKFILFYM